MHDFYTATVKIKSMIDNNTYLLVSKRKDGEIAIFGTNRKQIEMNTYQAMTIFKYFRNIRMTPDDEIEFCCDDGKRYNLISVRCTCAPLPDKNKVDNAGEEEEQENAQLTITINSVDSPSVLPVIINIDRNHLFKKLDQIFYVLAKEH
mgnify:CR=1 FL=1